jgi:DNA-binding NarL/FixJ family response regulator
MQRFRPLSSLGCGPYAPLVDDRGVDAAAAARSLRVLVHDRLPLFCLGVLRLLNELALDVTAQSETDEVALRRTCEARTPDVVVLGLPVTDDVAALTHQLRAWGVPRIILLYPGRLTDHSARLAGADIDERLPFTAGAGSLLAAITGHRAIDRELADHDRRSRPARPLSSFEHQVLQRASAGETAIGVSRALGVHPNQVQAAVRGVLRSTGARSMSEAVTLARRIRLAPPE